MTAGPEHTAIFQLPSVIAGQLLCTAGSVQGQSWALSAGTIVIGRLPELDVPLPEEVGVSKYHAKIVAEGLHYTLYDTESRNGTLVNGQPVQKAELCDGDEIQVCGCVLRFSQGPAAAQSGAPAPGAQGAPTARAPAPQAAVATAPVAPAPVVSAAPPPVQAQAPANADAMAERDSEDMNVDMDETSSPSDTSNDREPREVHKATADAPEEGSSPSKKRRARVLFRDAIGGLMFALLFVAGPSLALIGFGPSWVGVDAAGGAWADGGTEGDGGVDDAGVDGGQDVDDLLKRELAALQGEVDDAADDSAENADAKAVEDKPAADEEARTQDQAAVLARVNAGAETDERQDADEDEEIASDDDYDEEKDTSYRNPKTRKKNNKRIRKTQKRNGNISATAKTIVEEDAADDDDASDESSRNADRRPAARRYPRLSTEWFPVRVVAGEPVVVRSSVGGRVRVLHHPQGARVTEGEPLAEMDMRATDAKIETLKVSIQALEGVAASQDDAKAYLREERAKLRGLIATRQKSSIDSPTTGRLTEIFIAEGDKIRARHVVAKVMPENTNEVFARVPENIGRALEPGAPAEFRLSNGRVKDGRVRAIKQQQSDYRVLLQGNPADLRRVQEVRFP